MKSNYYFLTSSLPILEVSHPPLLHYDEFMQLLKENLSSEDYKQIVIVLRYLDLQNLHAYFRGDEHNKKANFSREELEDALLNRMGFPEYVFSFLDTYENDEERSRHFSQLYVRFFREETPLASGFLKSYLEFERSWRLLMVAFRSKKLKRDVSIELQHEDPYDPVVAHILAQKDSPKYEPPAEHEQLKNLFEENEQKPFELHQALCLYRFNCLEAFYEGDTFSIERVIGYMTQLLLVEKWMELDQEKGQEIVNTMVEETV